MISHCEHCDSADHNGPGDPHELTVEIDSDLPDAMVSILCAVFEEAIGGQWILDEIRERPLPIGIVYVKIGTRPEPLAIAAGETVVFRVPK